MFEIDIEQPAGIAQPLNLLLRSGVDALSPAADAAAQSAVAAAAVEVPDDWGCDPDHPDLLGAGQYHAYRAVQARLSEGGVKPKSVIVTAAGCNIIATVTVGGLSARWPGLEHTAAACSAPGKSGPLIAAGKC
ncbi:MAG: hypothetical protein KTV68_03650 [Acidimicrobiia bacterium]|nr:hypothetical protein [Acidimicrobiia bacterium]MCY4435469.1 hypothetical protein [bacterium]